MGRALELRRAGQVLNLNDDVQYALDADGWVDAGERLTIRLILRQDTLPMVEQRISALERMLSLADMYRDIMDASPCFVYTKTCDSLSITAEFGATWKRKIIRNANVSVRPLIQPATLPGALVTLDLTVSEFWERAAPIAVATVASGGQAFGDGGYVNTTAVATNLRRLAWTSTTGLTMRVRWIFTAARTLFFNANNVCYCSWEQSSQKFAMYDNAGQSAMTSVRSFMNGEEVDIVFRYQPGVSMAIWVNGVQDAYRNVCSFVQVDEYGIFQPVSGVSQVKSIQLWPAALSDAECASLYKQGRPEPEIPFSATPGGSSAANTAMTWRIWNVPGSAPARLRAAVTAATAAESALRVGVRPYNVPRQATGGPTIRYECETATLGANTSAVADSGASNGNVARFTPANTDWAARVTVTLVNDVDEVKPYWGPWRVLLQAKDNATNVQVNQIRWRVLFRGVPVGDYSDTFSFPSVNTRNLIDLGLLQIPPFPWPEGAPAAATSVSGAVSLALEVRNTVGSSGGTLDLDCLFLVPSEMYGVIACSNWTTSDTLMLDYASDPPSTVLVDGTWLNYQVKAPARAELPTLELPACTDPDNGNLLSFYLYRDESYQCLPTDTGWAWFLLRPRWRRA